MSAPVANGAVALTAASSEQPEADLPDQARSKPPGESNFVDLVSAEYRGPLIDRYFGDHWSMHLPFAYELMRDLRPRVFVELGVWKGESYFAFCQSAAENNVPTKCFGVDTWRGDIHMGNFDPELGVEVANYNWRYSRFSTLKPMTFMEALNDFEDETVDLLHIDGAHTYLDLQRDFDTWLPKVAPGGVVLFHDVSVRERNFGVWKVWEQVARDDNSFLFEFGYGLGVWKKGRRAQDDPPVLHRLLHANEGERLQIHKEYATKASALALWRSTIGRSQGSQSGPQAIAQIFADQGDGYSLAWSRSEPVLQTDAWQTIRFDHLERFYTDHRTRLRVDPVDRPAILTISSIQVVRERDGAVMYSADSVDAYNGIEFSSNLLRQTEGQTLMLVAADPDPQFLLPPLPELGREASYLAVTLKIERAAAGTIFRYHQAIKERADLQALADQQAARLEALANAGQVWERTFQDLRSSIEASRTDGGRLIAELQAKHLTHLSQQQHITALEATSGELERQLAEVQRALEQQARERELESQGHVKQLELKNGELVTKQHQLESELAELEPRAAQLQTENAHLARESARLLTENAGRVEHIRQLAAKCGALEQELPVVIRRLHEAERQTSRVAAELERVSSELVVTETRAHEREGQLRALEATRLRLEIQVQESRKATAELRSEGRGRGETIRTLEQQIADSNSALAKAEETRNAAQRELAERDAQISAIRRELRQYTIEIQDRRAAGERLLGLLQAQQDSRDTIHRRTSGLENELSTMRGSLGALTKMVSAAVTPAATHLRLLGREVSRLRKRSVSGRISGIVRTANPGAVTDEDRRNSRIERIAGKLHDLQQLASEAVTPISASAVEPMLARLTGVLFDADWYLGQNKDVLESGTDPLTQYLVWGASEGRDPHPLFASGWYSDRYPEVSSSGTNLLLHFVETGGRQGMDPHPLFHAAWYLAQNPDVAANGANPLVHYLEWGAAEGRDPNPLFDSAWYLQENPELSALRLNPLIHYVQLGARQGCDPHPLFDARWYIGQHPDAAEAGTNPLAHYLQVGIAAGHDPHPLFKADWYAARLGQAGASPLQALEHYLTAGGAEGQDPHPLFASDWYVSQHASVVESGLSPLAHYLRIGARAGHSPHPLFDVEHYRAAYLSGTKGWVDPVVHYLTEGWKLGYRPHREFDPQFYLRTYPDIAEAGLEPFSHYVAAGKAEGRMRSGTESSFVPYEPAFEIPRTPALPSDQRAPEIKAITFYLPQFHRIPQNDEWWGEGFTEWTNVRRGQPNFNGHYQPHVPSEFGYYDLDDPSVLERQVSLARQAGIYGFCFYYYWFGGEVLLDLPVRRMVETGLPDFPFCICWANENWTRRWDGKENEILIAQQHSPADDIAFIERITSILTAKSYIRLGEKPVLLVYRPSLLPDAAATLQRWRHHFREGGHGELHLVMVRSFSERASPEVYGFDAAVQFPPHFQATPVTDLIPERAEQFGGYIYDYTEVRGKALEEYRSAPTEPKLYPGVMPSWDNTARRGANSSIWVNSSPEAYSEWLGEIASLVRVRNHPAERFLFINAWNEWAEGCHLEPDNRFGYAWLNATSLALRDPSLSSLKSRNPLSHPAAPVQQALALAPLTGPVKLNVSVLLYHREDILPGFLRKLLPQIDAVANLADVTCELFLSFNYQATAAAVTAVRELVAEILPDRPDRLHLIENGFNLGFGEGHNAVFHRYESDIFLTLNSDLQVSDHDWLAEVVERFRTSDAAIVGLAENASRLREDACGIPVERGTAFDFVDGSLLAIRSNLAKRFGLFSRSFNYFYFEDADLCLRYRQLGARIDLLDIKCQHERSSSSQLLPQYAIGNVLDRNRARFFGRWGKYLQTRTLPNRLGLRFEKADRQLQCASLPAIFGLLAEHPTAVLDLWGVHEQIVPLFRHKRIRLIPSWQTLRHDDYIRYYELPNDFLSQRPRVVEISEQLTTEIDLEAARMHLETLGGAARDPGKVAMLFLPRTQPLFEGRAPDARSLLASEQVLRRNGFSVRHHTELSKFEIGEISDLPEEEWEFSALRDGLAILTDLVSSALLVTGDSWLAELAQILNKQTFLWLGAISPVKALWNLEQAAAFRDRSLTCLGCHERFGQAERNVCLRGDVACMGGELASSFADALERFLDGERFSAADAHGLTGGVFEESAPSLQLDLGAWPHSSAASVLVLTPVNPLLGRDVLDRARQLAERATRGMRGSRLVYDDTGEAPPRGATFPHRLAALTPLRQAMIERHLRNEQWVFWVDADLVEYPANLIDELVARAEGGIAAPLVLMEGDVSEAAYPAGFGPGRFYDIAGFVENARWAQFTPPYFDQIGPVYRLDSVGCCYLVNADLYRWGARHELDYAARAFIEENRDWADDAIQANQAGPANSFTDHYSVCEFARGAGVPVQAFGDLIAYHQRA